MDWIRILLIAIGLIFLVPFGWLVYKFITAPMGYEDEEGFHFGRPGDPEQ